MKFIESIIDLANQLSLDLSFLGSGDYVEIEPEAISDHLSIIIKEGKNKKLQVYLIVKEKQTTVFEIK